MQGTLQEKMEKNGRQIVRKLNDDRQYTAADGSEISLHGRSLLFIRNVGHLMTIPVIWDSEGNEIPEGILDGVMTGAIALYDLKVQKKLAHWQRLYCETENARSAGSGVRQQTVFPR